MDSLIQKSSKKCITVLIFQYMNRMSCGCCRVSTPKTMVNARQVSVFETVRRPCGHQFSWRCPYRSSSAAVLAGTAFGIMSALAAPSPHSAAQVLGVPALERAWQDGALTWNSCGALLPLQAGKAVARVSDNFIRRVSPLE